MLIPEIYPLSSISAPRLILTISQSFPPGKNLSNHCRSFLIHPDQFFFCSHCPHLFSYLFSHQQNTPAFLLLSTSPPPFFILIIHSHIFSLTFDKISCPKNIYQKMNSFDLSASDFH